MSDTNPLTQVFQRMLHGAADVRRVTRGQPVEQQAQNDTAHKPACTPCAAAAYVAGLRKSARKAQVG